MVARKSKAKNHFKKVEMKTKKSVFPVHLFDVSTQFRDWVISGNVLETSSRTSQSIQIYKNKEPNIENRQLRMQTK